MRWIFSRRGLGLALLMALCVCWSAPQPSAQGAETAAKKGLAGKLRGRLPDHYPQVVTPEQREAIYKIQAEYQPRIQALKDQLQALQQEQKEKIAAVLTPEQKKQVEQAADKAKQQKDAKKADPPGPAI